MSNPVSTSDPHFRAQLNVLMAEVGRRRGELPMMALTDDLVGEIHFYDDVHRTLSELAHTVHVLENHILDKDLAPPPSTEHTTIDYGDVVSLDALPVGSILIDRDADAWEKRTPDAHGQSWAPVRNESDPVAHSHTIARYGPHRVVHIPGSAS